MTDLINTLTKLRRPQLLLLAARDLAGQEQHKQRHDFTGCGHPNGPLHGLLNLEACLNEKRRARQADYSVQQHIEILAALLGACSPSVQ
jgi:hypothetical protein